MTKIRIPSIEDDFTEEEAHAKIEQTVRSLRAFSGVPKGTLGVVRGIYPRGNGRFGLDIQWNVIRNRPFIDEFTKEEYHLFLEEYDFDEEMGKSLHMIAEGCFAIARGIESMARINCQEDRATGTTTNREESDRHDRVSI